MMCSTIKTCLPALIALLLITGPAFGSEMLGGRLDNVKPSPDGRRVAITFHGNVERPKTLVKRDRSELIIDFENTEMESLPAPIVIDHKPIGEIRLKRVGTGIRVVLDFGDYSVPDYGIKRLGDCYILFLGESELRRKSSTGRARVARRTWRSAKSRSSRSSVKAGWAAEPARSGTRLKIRSARVVDGKIILHVSDMNRPSRTYRIRLGVDLDQAGFTTAEIGRVRKSRKGSTSPTKTFLERLRATRTRSNRGPRKTGS
jgi:hypothetical protein